MRKLQFNWCYCSSPVQSYYYLFWFSYNLNNFIFINVFKTVKEFSSFFHGDVHISLNSWCLWIDRLFRTCCWWFVRLLENNWAQHQVFLNENISDMHSLKTLLTSKARYWFCTSLVTRHDNNYIKMWVGFWKTLEYNIFFYFNIEILIYLITSIKNFMIWLLNG